ncbi:MAG: oligosaccharide flippase family protein [Sedimentisphaerales bacterium]|nr:oligosaccharide flippase family protein [Sedimentisphaerales bacterium]
MTQKLKENSNLFYQSLKGGFWVAVLRIATHIIGVIKTIIIANVLFVEDFGIMSAAFLLMTFLAVLSETGYNLALIQKKGHIHGYLDTAWTVGLIRSVLLCLIFYAVTPYFVSIGIKDESQRELAVHVMRVMGCGFLFQGFSNIGILFFTRTINFRPLTYVKIAETLIDCTVSLVWLYLYRNVWAYVAGWIAAGAFGCVMGYVICDYRPKLKLDFSKAKELWQFGKWVYLMSILGFILTFGDQVIVWGVLGIGSIALYYQASRYATLLFSEITTIVGQVMFPAFSMLQDDIVRLREAYLKLVGLVSFVAAPLSIGIILLGPVFVRLVLKQEYHAMTPVLQILALRGLFLAIGGTRGPLFNAIGKPQANRYNTLLRIVIYAVGLYPLTRLYGITGIALTMLIINVVVNPLDFHLVRRLLKGQNWQMYRPFFYPLFAALCMGGIVFICRTAFFEKDSVLGLCIMLMVGACSYLGLTFLIDIVFKSNTMDIFWEIIALCRTRLAESSQNRGSAAESIR